MLSVVALLLVFASNVVTLSNDIKAVNRFMAGGRSVDGASNSTITTVYDADYIMCVVTLISQLSTVFSFIPQGKHGPEPTCWSVLGCLE